MSSIKYEVVGKVAVITIDRPEKMNALSLDNQYDLDAAWKQLKDDSNVVIGIITGSGKRAFCVGADLKDDKSLSDRNAGKPADYAEASLFPREYDLNKPVIAAINGHALGMGAAIAMQSDLRIISSNGSIGYPLVGIGMMPGALHDFWMASPSAVANYALYTGDPINAEDAYRAGIVNEISEPDDLMTTTMELADRIAGKAPLVIQAIKRAWDSQEEFREVKAWRDFARMGTRVDLSEDREEGREAFRQKRKPDWNNR